MAQFAKDNNIPFAGHPPKSVGLSQAAASGQMTIEHLSIFSLAECVDDPEGWFRKGLNSKFQEGYSAYYQVVIDFFANIDWQRCDAALQAMADQGTFYTPTLVMEFNDRTRVDEETFVFQKGRGAEWCQATLTSIDSSDANLQQQAYQALTDFLQKMHGLGIRQLAGSDTQNYCLTPGFSLHWELQPMVEAGLSPLEALRGATLHAAAAMQRADSQGQVKVGYAADLLLLSANPLDDIRHTQSIQGVIQQGRYYDNQQLTQLLSQAQNASQQ